MQVSAKAQENIKPYESEEAFLQDLQAVFEKDYGVKLEGDKLNKAGRNFDQILTSFL